MFLVAESREALKDAPWGLTPRVMRWAENVWLMDLTPCRAYWQAMAARRGKSLGEMLVEALRRTFPATDLRASLALQPWRAVLLWTAMQERGICGILSEKESFGHALLEKMPWSTWVAAAIHYGEHAVRAKVPRFNRDRHRQGLRHLEAAVERLRSRSPGDLRDALPPAVRRRFGTTLGQLWEWTFPAKAAAPLPEGFAWTPWDPPQKPRLSRHLEYSTWRWEELAPLLAEDLGKICRDERWHLGERVTILRWRLTLLDLTPIDVEILFRHPHDLHAEAKAPKTALLQAEYAYGSAVKRVKREKETDFDLPIVGWELVVDARLSLAPAVRDLFGEAVGGEAQALLDLENKLPVPLVHYALRPDWLPEDSFHAVGAANDEDLVLPQNQPRSKRTRDDDGAAEIDRWPDQAVTAKTGSRWGGNCASPPRFGPVPGAPAFKGAAPRTEPRVEPASPEPVEDEWLITALHRPLFLYLVPKPLRDAEAEGAARAFLERVETKWWEAAVAPERSQRRDYFRILDRGLREQWIFRDERAGWFQHGLFA